ncbi:DnaA regulatory inactivator Hda [Spongiibacter taiwanensis]|uniref:DnaA regulatory inactivator Hda n=1 Tax=Spongiibacter taiwanensis TaxID=1748242 RepID=UPI002034EF29|nr:DnaA regulatory inactivator Hda [Spongiibacter taiwanensis]USA43926.1 DnaA regulatory inactivator Hda [Spongiibacter taiwanensis]
MSEQQIPFAFRLDTESSFDNFYCDAERALVVDALRHQADGDGEKFIFLHALSGRSHLLNATAARAEALGRRACYLPMREVSAFPPEAVLDNLEALDVVCLDDLDHVAGDDQWERGLFNLYNRCLSTSAVLLASSSKSIQQLTVQLPDLHSRLQSFAVFQVPPMSDEARHHAFKLRAQRRGIELSDVVADFIMARCQRDFPSLLIVLDRLDDVSLAEKRRLTIPFVKSVMGW